MFGWAALDVLIGLFFMYLLLSIIGTAIQEAMASLLKLRASNLREGIENLLNDPKLLAHSEFKDLTAALYTHPAIKSLYRSKRKILGIHLESGPSYIPSRTFVMALLDEIRVLGARHAGQSPTEIARIGVDELFRDADAIVGTLPDCDLKTQLTLLTGELRSGASELDAKVTAAVGRLENWFNESMDRVSGWYRRKAKFLAIAIGFVMAVVLNADTVHVANTLWTDSNLRASLAAGAAAYLEGASKDEIADVQVSDLLDTLSKSDLPIGWRLGEGSGGEGRAIALQPHQNMLIALIGWIITGFALSLGSSFWFDMLNKVVNVRGSGPKVSTQTGQAVDKA